MGFFVCWTLNTKRIRWRVAIDVWRVEESLLVEATKSNTLVVCSWNPYALTLMNLSHHQTVSKYCIGLLVAVTAAPPLWNVHYVRGMHWRTHETINTIRSLRTLECTRANLYAQIDWYSVFFFSSILSHYAIFFCFILAFIQNRMQHNWVKVWKPSAKSMV